MQGDQHVAARIKAQHLRIRKDLVHDLDAAVRSDARAELVGARREHRVGGLARLDDEGDALIPWEGGLKCLDRRPRVLPVDVAPEIEREGEHGLVGRESPGIPGSTDSVGEERGLWIVDQAFGGDGAGAGRLHETRGCHHGVHRRKHRLPASR
jgi:hypothetical protein